MNEIIGHMGFASKYYVSGEQVGIGIQQVWSGLMVFRAGGIGTQEHYSILSSLMYIQNSAKRLKVIKVYIYSKAGLTPFFIVV